MLLRGLHENGGTKVKPSPNTEARIPVAHEELRVDKKIVEKGRVRIQTRVVEEPTWVRQELAREDVQVEWVDIDREVDALPEIRSEGDTLVIPLVEEVLVVEKRLVLRQEIRLTRRMVTENHEEEVKLRRVVAELDRTGPEETATPQPEDRQ